MTEKVRNYLEEEVIWRQVTDPDYPYEADFAGERLLIRLNDFSDESLYTLIVNNVEVASFDDWPEPWARPKDFIYHRI